MDVYVSGEGKNGAGLLVNVEVFGIKTGDLVEFCDYFADAGFLVVMPDWHRGGYMTTFPTDFSQFTAWAGKFPYSAIKTDFEKQIAPIFTKAGVKKIGGVGFCYGTWVNYHLGGDGKLDFLLNFHPSHQHIVNFWKEKQSDLVGAIKVPVLQFAAGNDAASVKPDGDDHKTLTTNVGDKNVLFKEFKDQVHGWVSRGDRKDEKIAAAQCDAWEQGLAFAKARL